MWGLFFLVMTAPSIDSSTIEERLAFVRNEWKCLHNCELCGKCRTLKGRSEETLYADYISVKRSYMEITLEIWYRKRTGRFAGWYLDGYLAVISAAARTGCGLFMVLFSGCYVAVFGLFGCNFEKNCENNRRKVA